MGRVQVERAHDRDARRRPSRRAPEVQFSKGKYEILAKITYRQTRHCA